MDNVDRTERKRIRKLKQYEEELWKQGFRYIAGIDEVGRGPIAGPVVVAAVVLPQETFIAGVDDSKKLSANKRKTLAAEIKVKAISWTVVGVNPPYLDEINILNATRTAMHIAVAELCPRPDFLLIDALKLSDININQQSLIKGDSLSFSIACASILAKVERDASMEYFDVIYPGYDFAKHKGYATRQHIQALMDKGPCSIHRSSFEPVKSLLSGGTYGQQPGLFDQDDA
ncbi:MAG: ribonuclease HII [Syntrophomonadaceae bacterium]|nr:ribonuclease HII [Syntrophomonadaceae bacterium]